MIDSVGALNRKRLGLVGDPEIAARIAQYKMAFRMQVSIPDLTNVSKEPQSTKGAINFISAVSRCISDCAEDTTFIFHISSAVKRPDGQWNLRIDNKRVKRPQFKQCLV